MASGSLTLLEGAKSGTDMLKKGVIETLVTESPLLEMVPFTQFEGNALEVTVEATLPSPEFRNVNETYNKSFGTDTKRFYGVSILGGEVFIDNYILKVQSNKGNAKARQWAKFAKAMSRTWDKYFFDGTGAAKDFKGINALIAEGLGISSVAGANGAALTLDMLDVAKDLIRSQSSPDAILSNRTMRRAVTSLARSTYSGVSLIDVGTDVFGRQVTMYDGTPIRIIGDDKDGNAILGFDETQGTETQATSMYFIAFGEEDNVTGLAGLGGSLDVNDFGETEAAPGHLGRVEWYPGVAIYNPYSVVRLSGLNG